MILIPETDEIYELSKRILWFEPPEKSLTDTVRFLAYAFTYASIEDMQLLRKYVSDDDLRYALKHAPPGIIDARSWSYWHLLLDCYPPPPLPTRFGVKNDWQK